MMSKTLLFLFTALLFFNLSGQNRIEVLVNGSIQKINNESIRVKDYTDVIELKIYFDASTPAEKDIIGLNAERCWKHFQEQEQTAPHGRRQTEKDIITFPPNVIHDCIYFKFQVSEVSSCPGKRFTLSLVLNGNKSLITGFKGYQNKYKFYFVL